MSLAGILRLSTAWSAEELTHLDRLSRVVRQRRGSGFTPLAVLITTQCR
jgi:hypothetical protein